MGRRRKKLPADPVDVSIETLSHDGRGIARIDGKTTFRPVDGDATLTTYIKCDALLSVDETANEVLAAEIADAILATHTKSSERNMIHVALIYGYDIGISSFWRSNSYSFSPAQWKERIKNTSEYH